MSRGSGQQGRRLRRDSRGDNSYQWGLQDQPPHQGLEFVSLICLSSLQNPARAAPRIHSKHAGQRVTVEDAGNEIQGCWQLTSLRWPSPGDAWAEESYLLLAPSHLPEGSCIQRLLLGLQRLNPAGLSLGHLQGATPASQLPEGLAETSVAAALQHNFSLCPFSFVFFCFVLFLFLLFRATPAAYGDSQARGQIGAVAAGLCHSHSIMPQPCNARSEPCLWPTPQFTATPDPLPTGQSGIEPASSWMLVRFINHWATMGTPHPGVDPRNTSQYTAFQQILVLESPSQKMNLPRLQSGSATY